MDLDGSSAVLFVRSIFSLTAMSLFVSINMQFSEVECYHEKEMRTENAAENGGSL